MKCQIRMDVALRGRPSHDFLESRERRNASVRQHGEIDNSFKETGAVPG